MSAASGDTRPRAVLIGAMAAGKTSVGRALARRWQVPFLDLDQEVVRRAGLAIPEIFSSMGEQSFRELEADVLAELLVSHDGVLALGGGAPLTARSAQALASHQVVLLEIDERAAALRLHEGRGRPLLAGGDPMERWRTITADRLPAYRRLARCRVDGSRRSPAAVARAIDALLAPGPTRPTDPQETP